MTTPVIDDVAAIAARLKEVEAEREKERQARRDTPLTEAPAKPRDDFYWP